MNQTNLLQPSFMQKLLGRNYKWWYFIIYNLKSQRAYFGDTIMWTLYGIFSILGSFFIWWLTTKSSGDFNTSEILTYLFIGNLISSLINNWAQLDLGWMNRGGSISNLLILPTSFIKYMYVKFIGRSMLGNYPIQLFAYLLLSPLIKDYFIFPSSVANVFSILLFVPVAYSINFFLNFSFGCLTFWITETDGANNFYGYFSTFLSGGLIPLFLLFPFTGLAITFQPFAWLLHHPMQIYLGEYSALETLYVFLGGITWCVVLYFLAKWVFRMGLKRNESVGL